MVSTLFDAAMHASRAGQVTGEKGACSAIHRLCDAFQVADHLRHVGSGTMHAEAYMPSLTSMDRMWCTLLILHSTTKSTKLSSAPLQCIAVLSAEADT